MYSMKFLIKFGGFPVALEMKTLTPRVEKLHVCLFVLWRLEKLPETKRAKIKN